MKVFTQTFGCQMNEADSREMSRHFTDLGHVFTPNKEEADVLLLNTCTVRQHAEDKALSFIGRLKDWKRKDPRRVLIVTGCAAERLRTSLKRRFPHIDLVIGAKSIDQFPKIVNDFLVQKMAPSPRVAAATEGEYNWFSESEETFGKGKLRNEGDPFALGNSEETAFVTVMRGCNYSCSYCIVPFVRGREIYRPPETILEEVAGEVERGKRKVMLLGQTVNSYWHKGSGAGKILEFSDLIEKVNALQGVEEIRFMSPHPHYMSDKLISALARCKKVSPEIHLPVQSGSDAMLKAMNRNYTRGEYVGIACKLRKAVPDLRLSTDFIVGFPGETEDDFNRTLSLTDEVRFSLAYCFKYSPRKGTGSFCFKDEVPASVKEERLSRLLEKIESFKADPLAGAVL